MGKNIIFAVKGSNALNKLSIGSTMIQFIESSPTFVYFREQCIDIVNKYQSLGEYSTEKALVLKEYIRGCHPYCNALIKSEFDKVVTDCIIEYICESEGIGPEELWVRNLSAKDVFGKEIFYRISEYKTGHAINQWANLLRMQQYAVSKTKFLFDGAEASREEYEARKLYFDMAFALSAQELGCEARELPQNRRYSVALLPEAATILSGVVSTLRPVVNPLLSGRKSRFPKKGEDCLHDQMAGIAANTIINLERPLPHEIDRILKKYASLPEEVYEPSCFKAIIDLEFDKLIMFNLLLQNSAETGSYIVIDRSIERASTETSELRTEEIKDLTVQTTAAQGMQEEPLMEDMRVPEAITVMPQKAELAPEPEDSCPPSEEVVAEDNSPRSEEAMGEEPVLVESRTVEPLLVSAKPISIRNDLPPELDKFNPVDSVNAMDSVLASEQLPASLRNTKKTPLTHRKKKEERVESKTFGFARNVKVRQLMEDPNQALPTMKTVAEINERCKLVCNNMKEHIGPEMSDDECREWFKSLVEIRYCMGVGKMTAVSLDRFLDATEKIYGITAEK